MLSSVIKAKQKKKKKERKTFIAIIINESVKTKTSLLNEDREADKRIAVFL